MEKEAVGMERGAFEREFNAYDWRHKGTGEICAHFWQAGRAELRAALAQQPASQAAGLTDEQRDCVNSVISEYEGRGFTRIPRVMRELLSRAAPSGEPVAYVECRECGRCGHTGINDAHSQDECCSNCDWTGPAPKEDVCPGCAQTGTMRAACPKCGSVYRLLCETTVGTAPQPSAQQAEQPAEDDTPAICDPRYFEDDVQPAEEARGDCAACGGTGDVSGEYPGVACSACGGSGRALLAAPAAALPMACLNQDHSDCAMFGAAPVAAEGEEIHVHIEGHDVYTATLQPSGMASPRFVVHVKAAAAEAQVSDLPERDRSKPAERQGLFRKFDVRRRDGSDLPGGKHHGCRYFVLDVDHDPHAAVALAAYANACEATHPELARDLREKWNVAPQATHSRQAQGGALSDEQIASAWHAAGQTAGTNVEQAIIMVRAILARAASEPRVEGALSESSADEILANHASRLAFELECCLFDNQRFFDQACAALGAYKADVEKLYPSPPTFMGEPIPAERKERYRNMRQERAAHHPTGGGNAD